MAVVEDHLAEYRERVGRLRAEWASGDIGTHRRLLKPAHNQSRFQNYDPEAPTLSDADARLLIANEEGYAFAAKYESYLNLAPDVRRVIIAVRAGDSAALREILRDNPAAANPRWVDGYAVKQIPNDSIPLFCVCEGVFRGTNQQHNEYELVQALVAAGANITIDGDIVLSSATSFNVIRAAEALLDAGAPIDGVDQDGTPIAYALHFGFSEIAELFANRGAKLDVRFAAGVGRLDEVRKWFNADGSLKPGAGALVDPYAAEYKHRGESPFRCERTRANILSQALCFACTHRHIEVAGYLLSQGADVNAIVPGLDSKATVLHRVVHKAGPHTRAMVQFLLDHGADRTIRDGNYNSTPAGWACHFGNHEIAKLLEPDAHAHCASVET
ncbi:MAG TPA: ankyrin repeat domain-containing protein [Bryobacteraceae bacterium]|jgi:ankyrin repeat protein